VSLDDRVAPEDALAGMLAVGMSSSFAQAVLETARSFNADEPWGTERRSVSNSSPTTLAEWAQAVLAKQGATA
jgi:hypothetical protein